MMVLVVLPSPDGPNTATIVAIKFFYSFKILLLTAKIFPIYEETSMLKNTL
jgi:hypothetical protein